MTTEAHGSDDWNIMLMTEYKDMATKEVNKAKADNLQSCEVLKSRIARNHSQTETLNVKIRAETGVLTRKPLNSLTKTTGEQTSKSFFACR